MHLQLEDLGNHYLMNCLEWAVFLKLDQACQCNLLTGNQKSGFLVLFEMYKRTRLSRGKLTEGVHFIEPLLTIGDKDPAAMRTLSWLEQEQ